tara:strand:- start:18 stop:275 length:258 start_codon:yes stop_codon:yes gene_type:complete
MAKATKVTKSELEELRLDIRNINDLQMKIGSLEVQKTDLLSNIIGSQKRFRDFQEKLKKKYGDVAVNIHDGTLKFKENGEADKKD